MEHVLWGGELRERLLIALLGAHYESVFRRQWKYAVEPAHYFDHRIDSFAFATGTQQPYVYFRGFFAVEMIREGAVLLDIGCGDRTLFPHGSSLLDALMWTRSTSTRAPSRMQLA